MTKIPDPWEGVSSQHPVDPWTRLPVQLTPEQAQAIDPEFMRSHPQEAALNRYYNPFAGNENGFYQMGSKFRDTVMGQNKLDDLLDKGPMMGAGVLGGVGALGGGAIGAISDAMSGNKGSAKRLALLLGAAGVGLGALGGYMHRQEQPKFASFRSSFSGEGMDPRDQLAEAVSASQSINFNERMRALAAIPKLSDWQARSLLQQIGSLGGMAAGAAIMRFLFGAGLMGTLAGGAAGGMMGRLMGSQYGSGPLGTTSMSGFDFNGNRLF